MKPENIRMLCRCEKCGEVRLYSIEKAISGEQKCDRGRFSHNEACRGELVATTNDMDDALCNVRSLLDYINAKGAIPDSGIANLAKLVAEDFGEWMDNVPQTPEQEGLVGKDGRP